MLRVCVIGMGHIGNIHAWAYSENPNVELVGVCDIIIERAQAAGKKFDVPFYFDAQDMLKELKPDLCSITTGGFEYSSDHYLPTIQALEAGCHVLCEKPISNDIECGRKMVETAQRLNRCFAIDMNHRFTQAAYQAKKWQNDGKIGELLFCNMALWIGRTGKFDTEYYHMKALNPHSVDIMRHFMGDVDEVSCFAMKAEGREIYSTSSINMRFKCGAVGHLTSSYDISRGHPMERCEVAGINGRMIFEDMWRESTLYPAGNLVKEIYTNPVFDGHRDFNDTFRNRIFAFVEEIINGVRPEDINGSGLDGLKAQTVIHSAIQSLRAGGKPVKVDECTFIK